MAGFQNIIRGRKILAHAEGSINLQQVILLSLANDYQMHMRPGKGKPQESEGVIPEAHTRQRLVPFPTSLPGKPHNSRQEAQNTQKSSVTSVTGNIKPRINVALVLQNKA